MPVFNCAQLIESASAQGGSVRFQHELPDDMPVLAGEQVTHTLHDGLVLYLSQSRDLVNASSSHTLAPGITAAFLLQGQADVCLPGQRLQFDASRGCQRSMLVNLTSSDQFHRHWLQGREETKLCLSLTREWLEQFAGAGLRQFSNSHWQSQPWQPSAEILQRARQLLPCCQGDSSLLQRLRCESFALDLAADIVQTIEQPPARGRRLGGHLEQCLLRLKEWLDSGEADDLSISQMARELGTNPVDLQNGFRRLNGITIAAYLRGVRLEKARQAMRTQALSVEQAALMAGYEHVSSFSAAFKRHYGMPPSQAR